MNRTRQNSKRKRQSIKIGIAKNFYNKLSKKANNESIKKSNESK